MIEALKNIGFIVTERLERKELSPDFLRACLKTNVNEK